MYAAAAAMSARLVATRAQLVVLACIAAGLAYAGSAELTVALTAMALTALMAAHVADRAGSDSANRTDTTLRKRTGPQRVARLCDPDAAGRPRPRAPTA
jgi:hypothetical protein